MFNYILNHKIWKNFAVNKIYVPAASADFVQNIFHCNVYLVCHKQLVRGMHSETRWGVHVKCLLISLCERCWHILIKLFADRYMVNLTEKYLHFLLWMCHKLWFILSRNLSNVFLRHLTYHSYSCLPFFVSAHDNSDNFCLIRTALRNTVIKELCQCLICLPLIVTPKHFCFCGFELHRRLFFLVHFHQKPKFFFIMLHHFTYIEFSRVILN